MNLIDEMVMIPWASPLVEDELTDQAIDPLAIFLPVPAEVSVSTPDLDSTAAIVVPSSKPEVYPQCPSASENNEPAHVSQAPSLVIGLAPGRQGEAAFPSEILSTNNPSKVLKFEAEFSTGAAALVRYPSRVPNRPVTRADLTEILPNEALAAFQVRPHFRTATQLAAATGNAPLMRGFCSAVLLSLCDADYHSVRRCGQHTGDSSMRNGK